MIYVILGELIIFGFFDNKNEIIDVYLFCWSNLMRNLKCIIINIRKSRWLWIKNNILNFLVK